MRKMLIVILSCILYTACTSNSTGRYSAKSGGTMFTGSICNGGIIIAADSKCVFQKGDTICAYYEGIKKVFKIQGYLVAFAGHYSFANLHLAGVIEEFEKSLKRPLHINEVYSALLNYMKENFSMSDYIDMATNNVQVAGYQDNIPNVIFYRHNDMTMGIDSFYINNIDVLFNNIEPFFADPNLCGELQNNSIEDNTRRALALLDGMVNIEQSENGPFSKFGGKSSIYVITPHKTFSFDSILYEFKTVKEFQNAFLKKQINMKYRTPDDSIGLRKAIINNTRDEWQKAQPN